MNLPVVRELPELNRFRGYLRLLAEIELGPQLRAKEDASDIVQQTFLEAHRDLPDFRGQTEAELVGWLKAILARNLLNVARHYRSQKRDVRREQVLAERLDRSSARLERLLASEENMPSEGLMRNERSAALAEALARLLEAERTAIVLKHFHGWSLVRISNQLGRPVNAVAGLLKRGLKKLRAHLQESE